MITESRPRSALVVDDAAELRELVAIVLESEGYEVTQVADGASAVQAVKDADPELVVMDVVMPEIDGVEACRQIRTFSDAYIMMLSGRDDEVDVLVGLAVGADGYMTKPFSPRELAARVKAMTRRARPAAVVPVEPVADRETAVRRFGALVLDPVGRTVSIDGVEIDLTRTEFDLLDVLTGEPNVAFRRDVLLDRVWGRSDSYGSDHVVDVHMANLRRKLGEDPRRPRFIRTYRGVGYRIITD